MVQDIGLQTSTITLIFRINFRDLNIFLKFKKAKTLSLIDFIRAKISFS